MSDADKEQLRENMNLAKKLGATIETVFGDDVSYQIAEYARLSGITKIVVGRSAMSKRRFFGKPTLTEKLTQIAPNIDIHIIPDASTDAPYRPKNIKRRINLRTTLRDLGVSLGDFLRHILSTGSLDKLDMENHRVKELVRRDFCPPISIDADETEVVRAALNQNFVPIVDSRNTLCGILTRRGVIAHLAEKNGIQNEI